MPSGGQTTDEMLIRKWNKNPGDPVKRGDVLFEIETDKASMPVESFAEGTLLAVLYNEGDMVKAGELVAYIGDPGDKIPEEPGKQIPGMENKITKTAVIPNYGKNTTAEIPRASQKVEDLKITYASPLAKNKAKIENINIEDIADLLF